MGRGVPQGWGPARVNGGAKVLAFWLEKDPHINPPQGRRQSSRGVGDGEVEGLGLASTWGPSPDLGPVARADGYLLLCQLARMARRPGGRSALAQALWCQLGLGRPGAGEEGSGEPRGPTPAPLPASCSRAGVEGPSEEGRDSLGLALQLLRSETVKVYVNNEINILVSFFF